MLDVSIIIIIKDVIYYKLKPSVIYLLRISVNNDKNEESAKIMKYKLMIKYLQSLLINETTSTLIVE